MASRVSSLRLGGKGVNRRPPDDRRPERTLEVDDEVDRVLVEDAERPVRIDRDHRDVGDRGAGEVVAVGLGLRAGVSTEHLSAVMYPARVAVHHGDVDERRPRTRRATPVSTRVMYPAAGSGERRDPRVELAGRADRGEHESARWPAARTHPARRRRRRPATGCRRRTGRPDRRARRRRSRWQRGGRGCRSPSSADRERGASTGPR